MKTRLVTLSEEYKVDFDEALQLAKGKLAEEMVTGRGKGTWITPEGVEILKEAFDIPEIVPKHIQVKILKECPNRCYNWGYSQEIGKRVPVLLPRKYWGRMVGKTIAVECITDDKGVSYRYVPKKKQRA